MKIPYEKFEEQYLNRARTLSCDNAEPEVTAKKLCETVYKSLDRKELQNNKRVNFVLAERFYSDFVEDKVSPTARVSRLIYGKVQASYEPNWIPFEECLNKLKPILFSLPLIDRLIAALYLVGWGNKAIAELFNETLEQFSNEIQSVQTLVQIDQMLTKLRGSFAQRVSSLDDNGKWLSVLVRHKDNPTAEFDAWQVLKGLYNVSPHVRFARGRNPGRDRFGRLRDRWDGCKKCIRQKLKQESLFQG